MWGCDGKRSGFLSANILLATVCEGDLPEPPVKQKTHRGFRGGRFSAWYALKFKMSSEGRHSAATER